MSTINISVTDEQAVMVDRWVKKYGFANRSELFRTILRFLDKHPEVLREIAGYKTNFPKK